MNIICQPLILSLIFITIIASLTWTIYEYQEQSPALYVASSILFVVQIFLSVLIKFMYVYKRKSMPQASKSAVLTSSWTILSLLILYVSLDLIQLVLCLMCFASSSAPLTESQQGITLKYPLSIVNLLSFILLVVSAWLILFLSSTS